MRALGQLFCRKATCTQLNIADIPNIPLLFCHALLLLVFYARLGMVAGFRLILDTLAARMFLFACFWCLLLPFLVLWYFGRVAGWPHRMSTSVLGCSAPLTMLLSICLIGCFCQWLCFGFCIHRKNNSLLFPLLCSDLFCFRCLLQQKP